MAVRRWVVLATGCACGAAIAGWVGAVPARTGEVWRWTAPVVVSDPDASGSRGAVALAVGDAATVHAVWVDGRAGGPGTELFGTSAPAEGGGWGLDRPVPGAGGGGGGRTAPAVAVDNVGAVHVVWVDDAAGDPDILHSRRAPGDRAWSRPTRVNGEPGAAIQWAPRVAADPWGNVHVVWVDFRGGVGKVLYRRLGRTGAWGATVPVTGGGPAGEGEPSLATTPGGDLFAVWVDGRNGTRDVYASRLPPSSTTWWPNAELSTGAGPALGRRPVVAAEGNRAVHAVWLDEATTPVSLRSATLHLDDPARPYWGEERTIYRPTRGDVLEVDAVGGPGGRVVVAWSEDRPDGSRIYAALLPHDGQLAPTRVDAAGTAHDGRAPRIVVDDRSVVHAVWSGTSEGGANAIFHATAALVRPAYARGEEHGWLQYRARTPRCGGDSYVLVACDGTPGSPVLPHRVDVTSLVGRYVTVRGEVVDDVTCPHLAADEIVREKPQCPRGSGSVTGILRRDGRPVEGARVTLGDQAVSTGASGRFFVDGVPGGTYVMTATAPCALSIALFGVRVDPDLVTTVADGALRSAEVVPDCVVDARDLVRIASGLRAAPSPEDACTDLDGDGILSLFDLEAVAASYGLACGLPWAAPTPAPGSP